MKITRVTTLNCDAGWRPWTFVKIETDEGIIGYGECSDNRNTYATAGCVKDLEPLLIGRDPRPIEMINADLYRRTRQSLGGIVQKAIAGIDCALWDIKAKALGVPVYELLGGPTRDKVRLYWSHCGTYRVREAQHLQKPPLKSLADVTALGQEVVSRGFTALKTNILLFDGESPTVHFPGFGGGYGTTDRNITNALIRNIEKLIGTFREAVGEDVDIALDLNFNFTTEGFRRIAKVLEPFRLMWVEIDTYDPHALLQIKESTSTTICSGENLYTTRGYRPFFDLHAMDVAMVDVPWNGFTASKKIADLAELYEINVAPHNYYSHLSTLISAHFAACVPNLRIMETDVDDVSWKDDLITEPLEIKDGHLILPDKPGWGTDLNEKEVAKHPWNK